MEKTKVWVVRASNGMMLGYSNPHAVFFSKEEADFYVWEKNNEPHGEFSFRYSYYGVDQVPVLSREKTGKQWDKFIKERIAEIDKTISEKNSHSIEDLAAVEILRKEKENLT